MVTHNLRYAAEYGDRLIMLDKGHIVIDRSGEEKKDTEVGDILKIFNEISIECGNWGGNIDRQGRILYNKGIKTVKGKTEMKKISGVLKLTLAVCMTVGTTLAMIACVANNSQGSSSGIGTASTSSPLETQTTTPTETTTGGQTETTTSTETTITPPIIDKKQETINKFLTLLY